jgi:purine-binding chemotaxis protein CheW
MIAPPVPAAELRELLVVTLDGDNFALAVEDVREVLRAAQPTALVNAPAVVEGVLNVRGELVPLLSIRSRLGRRPREMRAADYVVVARASGRVVAFAVDAVVELRRIPASHITEAAAVVAGTSHIEGIATLADGAMVIHDLGALVDADELFVLGRALAERVRT